MSNEVSFAQVEETMRAIADEKPNLDSMVWNWYNEAARRLSVSSDSDSRWVSASWKRFQEQARRALNKLADEGTLVKYGRGIRTGFRTAAAQQAIDREALLRIADRKAVEDRFSAIRARLKALGLKESVVLSADEWEQLLDLAEREL